MGYPSDDKRENLKPTIIEEGGITQVISKDGATAEQIELEPTFWQKVKNHFRRFWWIHVIVFICCFLIIIFPVIYVGYPKIAQTGVNNSRLSVSSLIMSDPYGDKFHLRLDQVLTSHSMFKPKLFAFEANLTLPGRGDDRPFTTVTVPDTVARNGQKIVVDQHEDIPSVEEFTRYTTTVLQTEEFDVIVVGRPKLQQGKLPKITVNYNQTVKMKGLNKLKGFSLQNMTMNIEDSLKKRGLPKRDSSGILGMIDSLIHPNSSSSSDSSSDDKSSSNSSKQSLLEKFADNMLDFDVPFTAIANFHNPTVMTLYLGNVTTYPQVDNKPIGRSIIHDVVLKPGNHNPFKVTGTMNIAKSLPALNGTKLDITLISNESIYHGRNLVYYSKSLATNLIPYSVDLEEVLKNSLPSGMSSLL